MQHCLLRLHTEKVQAGIAMLEYTTETLDCPSCRVMDIVVPLPGVTSYGIGVTFFNWYYWCGGKGGEGGLLFYIADSSLPACTLTTTRWHMWVVWIATVNTVVCCNSQACIYAPPTVQKPVFYYYILIPCNRVELNVECQHFSRVLHTKSCSAVILLYHWCRLIMKPCNGCCLTFVIWQR